MQYKHAFHAGNFADVHKHIALLQLIEALKKKAKGFLYLDTHAGEGGYDLAGADARHGGESAAGIQRFEASIEPAQADPHLRLYMERVRQLRTSLSAPAFYPGSPLLALASLRAVDQAICVESQAPVARALQRAVEHVARTIALHPRILHADGYGEIKSQLPPASRRGLVLIDPPYESQDEGERVAASLVAGLTRFETGVFAVWYPIKRRHDSDQWLARVIRDVQRPCLTAEFCLHPPDHGAGLNGSGLLVVNPPYEFDFAAQAWQLQLQSLLGATGGSRVHWLIREPR